MSFSKIKKKIIFLFLIGAVFYGYFLMILGMIWGYFLAKFLAGEKTGQPPKFFKSLIIKIKDYQLHFHHWLFSSLILVLGIIFQIPIIYNKLILGFLLGIVWQGINDYKDWKVIIKK